MSLTDTAPIKRKLLHSFQPHELKHTSPVYVPSATSAFKATTRPTTFSLRPTMAAILDQGNFGDCVSNAYALAIGTITKGPKQINMSRLYNYALARCNTGGSVVYDSGIYVIDGAYTISKYGICLESVWPYIPANFAVLPPLSSFQSSKFLKGFTAIAVTQDLEHIKDCLLTKKVPIIFGFMVYSSFMTNAVAKNGIVPMPNTKTESLEGGHCVCIVGYDDAHQWFICANSWGNWGDRGYFYMPYAYITDKTLASDFYYLSFTW